VNGLPAIEQTLFAVFFIRRSDRETSRVLHDVLYGTSARNGVKEALQHFCSLVYASYPQAYDPPIPRGAAYNKFQFKMLLL
jgi:hypothetical protein